MNTSINFNEVRKLAAQAVKRGRPILGCIRIEDGIAMWTDSFYIVVMEGYSQVSNITISLSDYSIKTDIYPKLETLINYSFGERSYTEEILDGKVVYVFERHDKDYKTFIDQETLDQVKRLINNKKFNLSIPEIELNEAQLMARVTVDPNTKIYFVLKKKDK